MILSFYSSILVKKERNTKDHGKGTIENNNGHNGIAALQRTKRAFTIDTFWPNEDPKAGQQKQLKRTSYPKFP